MLQMMKTSRLDILLSERGLCASREQAKRLILAGCVRVNGTVIDKAAARVSPEAHIEILGKPQYVSRGGYKLAAALDAFGVNPAGRIAADVGASTGGFTDCLLQRGAARVYAIDVGYGQLAWELRQDARVVVMERVNARYLEALPEPVSLVTMDVSFISLRHILPQVARWLELGGEVIVLIKPQFEAGRRWVGKGGVIRDERVHAWVLNRILSWAREEGWAVLGLVPSPIKGPKGNIEFLAWFARGVGCDSVNIAQAIEKALAQVRKMPNPITAL